MDTLVRLAALTSTVLLLEMLLPGVKVKSKKTALVVAIVFSVLNVVGGWLVASLLVLPAILTFGLLFLVFPLIINAVMLWVTDLLIGDFEIKDGKSFWLSTFGITLVNAIVLGMQRP